MTTTKPRVALVTNVLSHYRVPCFQRLAHYLEGSFDLFLLASEMEHRHYVMAQGEHDLPVQVLPGRRWKRPPEDDLHWNEIKPVAAGKYDVVILSGWSEPTFMLLWLRHLLRRTRIFFWIESTLVDRPRTGGRELLKRLLLKRASGCLVPGQRAAEYCHHLGMAKDRITIVPNATDGEYFRRQADALAPQRDTLRQEFGLTEPTFLFVGRLVETIKGIEPLIRAVAHLADSGHRLRLLLAGEGPDRDAYASLIEELGAPVQLLGNLDHEQLCRYYAATDGLMLPSRSEVWGFVLNEAMEFAHPVVVSESVGAGPDLVSQGKNGFVVPVGDVDALAEALQQLLDPTTRERFGQASRRRIEDFSPDHWARGVLRGIGVSHGIDSNFLGFRDDP